MKDPREAYVQRAERNAGDAATGQPSQRTYRIAAGRQKSTFIHALLTVLTVGLWSPVWWMACADNARIRRAKAEVDAYAARQQFRPQPGWEQ